MIVRALFAVAVWLCVSAGARAAEPVATAPDPEHPGASLYQSLCSRCHGVAADGRGAEAERLEPPPPDLTRLAARDETLLRLETLVFVIDGRRTVRAHGNADMPVWGWELVADVPDPQMREQARIRLVQSLAEYLLAIQQPAPDPSSP